MTWRLIKTVTSLAQQVCIISLTTDCEGGETDEPTHLTDDIYNTTKKTAGEHCTNAAERYSS